MRHNCSTPSEISTRVENLIRRASQSVIRRPFDNLNKLIPFNLFPLILFRVSLAVLKVCGIMCLGHRMALGDKGRNCVHAS
jgi:hypothetical protein